MPVTVRASAEDYVSGEVVVHVQAATDDQGTPYWVVWGSTDTGDYSHSITDEEQAKALAEKVASTLDARARALAKYAAQVDALVNGDEAAVAAAFG